MLNTFCRIIFITFLFGVASPVFASQVFFEQRGAVIDVFLNTQGQRINAFEGTVIFDGSTLEVQKIQDDDSVVNFWIKKPEAGQGEIGFSGITPGGYSGSRGLLFSVDFSILKEGDVRFDVKNPAFLKNDGLGTADAVAIIPFTVQMVANLALPWYQNNIIWGIIIAVVSLIVLLALWFKKHLQKKL